MRFLVLGLAVLCLQLTAAPAPSLAGDLTGTLKRVAETGKFNMGVRETSPPMAFLNKDGVPVGYSIDLCEHIAAAVKKTLDRTDIAVNYIPVNAESRFDALEAGEIDILCGATTKTLSRSERVGFTQLTFVTGASLLSLEVNQVPNLSGLKGKRVAVVNNTTTIEILKQGLETLLVDAEVVPVASASDGMAMLDKGEVDALAADQVVLIGQVLVRNSGKQYFLSPDLFSFEPFALAIQHGDAEFQLVADRALSQLNRSGRIMKIYKKWFSKFAEKPTMALRALYQLNATPE